MFNALLALLVSQTNHYKVEVGYSHHILTAQPTACKKRVSLVLSHPPLPSIPIARLPIFIGHTVWHERLADPLRRNHGVTIQNSRA